MEKQAVALRSALTQQGLTPLAYMRKYGAFEVARDTYNLHEKPLSEQQVEGSEIDLQTHLVRKNGELLGVEVDGIPVVGFTTPSRKLEFFSPTMKAW